MGYQATFKRYEIKYLMTNEQKNSIVNSISSYMEPDSYGHTSIRNIYYDTDSFRLIRRSIERPCYKEKMRIRSYKRATMEEPVFVELKKKYKSVVYKRRLTMTQLNAMEWLSGNNVIQNDSQISEEIEYFRCFYKTLKPVLFLSYERDAYYSRCGDDFRVTFDENILARSDNLSLDSEAEGRGLLDKGMVLMEIKTSGAIPLWMTEILTKERLFKTSFSKYGTAYKNMLYKTAEFKERELVEQEPANVSLDNVIIPNLNKGETNYA